MDSSHSDNPWRDPALWGELALLALAAPLLYFPDRLPAWAWIIGLALLPATWVWRRVRLSYWCIRTPADWPIVLLLAMLPVALWTVPLVWRVDVSVPRSLIILWNIALFSTIAVHAGRNIQMARLFVLGFITAGASIAFASLFGAQWPNKISALSPILDRLPKYLLGVFNGAESGFSPNQLAGTLLTFLPLLIALLAHEVHRQRRWPYLLLGGLCLTLTSVVMIASQSRAGYVGLTVALLILILSPWRLGRRLLLGGSLLILIFLLVAPIPSLLVGVDAFTTSDSASGGVNMAGRLEIWQRAVYAVQDLPLTGVGLGTFRYLTPLLYPLVTVPMDYDIAHAHNFYLQTALDLGLPGMMALLALMGLAFVQGLVLWRTNSFAGARAVAVGLLAGLAGQGVYSLADAVAMGSKTNLFFWVLLALLFGLTSRWASTAAPQD